MKLIPVTVRILHLPDINGNKSSVLLNQAVTRLTAVLLVKLQNSYLVQHCEVKRMILSISHWLNRGSYIRNQSDCQSKMPPETDVGVRQAYQ